jgi:protein-S-isoprenylcysteine O-methyltransferase Ste14
VPPLADLTLVAWALVEVGVRVREGVQGKGRPYRDRATRVLIVMTLGAAIVAALGARSAAPTLQTPEQLRMAGVVVMWLGLALRIWAIAALGGAFRTTVEVEPGQTVVSTGPYRWIRHPSYAGLLLIVAPSARPSATGCRWRHAWSCPCRRLCGASMSRKPSSTASSARHTAPTSPTGRA